MFDGQSSQSNEQCEEAIWSPRCVFDRSPMSGVSLDGNPFNLSFMISLCIIILDIIRVNFCCVHHDRWSPYLKIKIQFCHILVNFLINALSAWIFGLEIYACVIFFYKYHVCSSSSTQGLNGAALNLSLRPKLWWKWWYCNVRYHHLIFGL